LTGPWRGTHSSRCLVAAGCKTRLDCRNELRMADMPMPHSAKPGRHAAYSTLQLDLSTRLGIHDILPGVGRLLLPLFCRLKLALQSAVGRMQLTQLLLQPCHLLLALGGIAQLCLQLGHLRSSKAVRLVLICCPPDQLCF
jgi:hypothetical protein